MFRRVSQTIVLLLCAEALCAALTDRGSGRARAESTRAVFSATAARCPFNFRDGMPPGVFCVYDGFELGSSGEACGDRQLVIWSRVAPDLDSDARDDPRADRYDVYFGFMASPELVLRAAVDADAVSSAAIIGYRLAEHQPRVGLRGDAELHIVPVGGGTDTEILSLRVDRPVSATGTCALTAYEGTFVGVMTLPPGAVR